MFDKNLKEGQGRTKILPGLTTTKQILKSNDINYWHFAK